MPYVNLKRPLKLMTLFDMKMCLVDVGQSTVFVRCRQLAIWSANVRMCLQPYI